MLTKLAKEIRWILRHENIGNIRNIGNIGNIGNIRNIRYLTIAYRMPCICANFKIRKVKKGNGR